MNDGVKDTPSVVLTGPTAPDTVVPVGPDPADAPVNVNVDGGVAEYTIGCAASTVSIVPAAV